MEGTMPVSDGDVVRGVIRGTTLDGDEFVNVFTYLIDKVSLGSWSDAEIGGFVEAAVESVFNELLAEIHGNTSFDTLDVYKYAAGVWDYLTTTTPSITPTGSGDVSPSGVAMLLTAYTDRNKVFGRKFVYGITEGNMTAGKVSATALANMADAAAAYMAAWQSGTMGPLDYLYPGVYSSAASSYIQFNGIAIVKDTLSYQRRRKKGVGV
jgi:hypothetical protein